MAPGQEARTAYAPHPAWPLAALMASGVLVGVTPALDGPGRVMASGAALLLVAVVARDALQRPVLEVVPPGLLLWLGLRRRLVAWDDVLAVRLGHERHWATRGPQLELDLRRPDGEPGLVVLPARRLGADPGVVAALLADLRSP